MRDRHERVRVLYSFPLRMGAGRICSIAWEQANGLAAEGADVTVFPASLSRPLPPGVRVRPTLARGGFRVPNRLVRGMAYPIWHDWIVSRRLEQMADQIDIIHTWPAGSLRTLTTAARLGIPTVLERCNAHTRFAYEVVQKECERLGISLPPGYEHAHDATALKREEEEYRMAYRLVCPSDFVAKTFLDQGFPRDKLVRHTYGVDEKRFHPDGQPRDPQQGLTMISVGLCAVRKGLHYALEAWLRSAASRKGTFLIAGKFLPAYQRKLSGMLAHPSVKVLGHRDDVPDLMRRSDILVLPTLEEGFPLVCLEAMGSGCVPVVSDVCSGICRHMQNALVHPVGDVAVLAQHIDLVDQDRVLLARLREEALGTVPGVTWKAAGVRLLEVYRDVLKAEQPATSRETARNENDGIRTTLRR